MGAHRLTTTLSAALLALATTACSASDGAVASPSPPRAGSGTAGAAGIGDPDFPLDGNGGYDVAHYGLKLSYDPGTRRLVGTATIDAKAVQDLTTFNLDLRGLTVSRVTVDGAGARFERRADELTVTAPTAITEGSRFSVKVEYSGVPEPIRDSANLGTYGFVPTADGSFVACEPNGAKTWFPSNDHPADKSTFDFEITVPEGITAIANGALDGEPKTSDGKTTFVWHEKHPMVTYLATMTTGKFSVRTGTSPGGIPIYAATDPRFSGSLNDLYTLSGKITDYWSKVFGPYPFSETGGVVDDFAAGYALENQTKPLYGGFGPDQSIISHELAHQWFGDSLSLTRWRDLWLNEGFATYAEWLWDEHVGDSTVEQTFKSHYANASDPMWSYPPGVARKNDLFDNSVYTRGAMTLHALRHRIGDETFFALLKKWTADHKYGSVTTEQFIALAEKMSGQQLDDLFDAWLFQPRRPTSTT